MSDAKSNYLENKVLDHFLGTASTTSQTPYLGLHIGDPTDTGAGGTGEVAGNGYARQSVSFGAASSGSASGPTVAKEFTASGGDWGTITHFALYDASTSGNMLYYGALTEDKLIEDGDTLRFAVNSITITEA